MTQEEIDIIRKEILTEVEHPEYSKIATQANEILNRYEKKLTEVNDCVIPVVSNSLDLRELERKLNEALGKETRETLTEWLKQQRQ